MGLAASQAKLLSLTCRISDNELRAQSLTAAKMALANQTSEASREYLKALNTSEFVYRTYDDNGDKVYTKLTGAQLSTYAPLKNQYALINPQGQVLVSELDAANYEDSANINEFLAKYGVDAIETGETRTVKNPAYDVAYEDWKKKYDEWMSRKPEEKIKIIDKEAWDEPITVETSSDLYQKFLDAAQDCFYNAAGSNPMSGYKNHTNCWMHVLTEFLGQGPHQPSNGDPPFELYPCIGDWKWEWNCTSHGKAIGPDGTYQYDDGELDIYSEIRKKSYTTPCSGDVIPNGVETVTTSYGTVEVGGPPSDPNMSIYQRAVDLLWEYHDDYELHNGVGGNARPDHLMQFFYWVEHDLKQISGETKIVHHPEESHMVDNPEYEEWKKEEPPKPDIDPTKEEKIYEYSDKDKAQWYVNLWHRMNGASDDKDGTETTTKTTSSTEVYSYGVKTTKTTDTVTRNRWDILEDGLMNSQDWLKYALESGAVTLERVNFADPTEEGTGIRKAQWTSIIYSNALDISEQTDEAAIARAEAKYQQKTREIENKDKQYDSMLKLLDTEHNALQQEYETTKTVISKNTERTIKIYQA